MKKGIISSILNIVKNNDRNTYTVDVTKLAQIFLEINLELFFKLQIRILSEYLKIYLTKILDNVHKIGP